MENSGFYTLKEKLGAARVVLVAVSKTKSVAEIQKLYDLGQRDFGENYVQELVDKQAQLPADIRWHFIGHLQRNKVKYIASFVSLVQSVDSKKLLHEIDKHAAKQQRKIDLLLQVHIADEATKFGFDDKELKALIAELNDYPNVNVRGLMGMATFTEDRQKVAQEFGHLKELFDQCNNLSAKKFDTLSMGMSADYLIAIENGSTMVRIGALLFGTR